jgi:hypothetical protein
MRDLCACTRRRHEQSSHAPGDASFARSFDPCTLILTMLRGESNGGGAFDSASRLGKLGQPRGTNTGAGTSERSAARRVSPLPQGRLRGTSRKGRRSRSPSLRGLKEPGFGCPHVVNAVAEVGRRRLASNKLGKRAPKRAAGSSERRPSSERRSAGETVGRRIERRDESRLGLTARDGRGPTQAQGGARVPSSGYDIAKSGAVVAGPGL